MAADDPIGAQVLLRTADGRDPGDVEIDAATIGSLTPPPEAVREVAAFFEAAGFSVGPVAGLFLPIVGSAATYEATLGRAPVAPGDAYPLDRLPPAVGALVASITAPPALDFGATSP